MKPFMHRNDLRFYKIDKLIEMSACLGLQLSPEQMQDIEKVKDAICEHHANIPAFAQPQTDKFLGNFR